MTDKQIIIDGVDVNGCEFYIGSKNLEFNCKQTPQSYFCKNQSNCYYKQLQREKQNSQEARDTSIKEFNRAEELKTLLQRKEQECEKLKAVLKAIANRPCLNINNCNGNCLPHCKWNAHKLAQEALKELE